MLHNYVGGLCQIVHAIPEGFAIAKMNSAQKCFAKIKQLISWCIEHNNNITSMY